jgi:hypothetical protein
MRAVKLTIPGEWWDSLSYKGHLYLFDRYGDLRILRWQRLIDRWQIADDLRMAITSAFVRGDSLYGARWEQLTGDPEVQDVLTRRFDRLGRYKLEASTAQIEDSTVERTTPEFAFPYGDITAYANRLWSASPEGLEVTHLDEDKPIPLHTERVWDCPLLSLSPNYGTIAMAAGDEGLFEMRFDAGPDHAEPRQTLEQNCSGCDWLYYSVYASSHLAPAQLAAYRKDPIGWDEELRRNKYERNYDRTVDEETVFPGTSTGAYSWGSADKIYKSTDAGIAGSRYMPGHPDPDQQFEQLGLIARTKVGENIVSARVAMFGVIIELEESLLILRSDGRQKLLNGAPINWRVFPRSNWYLNQLHAVYEDRLEIWSFNHDFLLDQEEKATGIRYRERGDPIPRRRRN